MNPAELKVSRVDTTKPGGGAVRCLTGHAANRTIAHLPMKPVEFKQDHVRIVYDAERWSDVRPEVFREDWWERLGRVSGSARGRGSAIFIDAPFGPGVLKQYRRGGLPAKFVTGQYLFTGYQRSRPFREFSLLSRLQDLGLPVPAPLAACCARSGLLYRGALITERVSNAVTLSDYLCLETPDDRQLYRVGETVARFHSRGVRHADLNGANIMVTDEGNVVLLDFDRGHFDPRSPIKGRRSLNRLRRSLEKLDIDAAVLEACWRSLEKGHHDGYQDAKPSLP
ncbi:MAG: 3-deoxy-D-manno-octulosonic acid kinase [Xanthomonadales bacterium]|nr:3-deoxy-D-manno-octulosonic acid kinase [Xanthomonadales bacterium]